MWRKMQEEMMQEEMMQEEMMQEEMMQEKNVLGHVRMRAERTPPSIPSLFSCP